MRLHLISNAPMHVISQRLLCLLTETESHTSALTATREVCFYVWCITATPWQLLVWVGWDVTGQGLKIHYVTLSKWCVMFHMFYVIMMLKHLISVNALLAVFIEKKADCLTSCHPFLQYTYTQYKIYSTLMRQTINPSVTTCLSHFTNFVLHVAQPGLYIRRNRRTGMLTVTTAWRSFIIFPHNESLLFEYGVI